MNLTIISSDFCLIQMEFITLYLTKKKKCYFKFDFQLSRSISLIVYTVHNIVRAIKSRRLRWTGHVARMEESRSVLKILAGKPTGKGSLLRA